MGVIERLKGKLIVSCQSGASVPIERPDVLAAIAQAAELGGAAGIRADSPANIEAIKDAVSIPVIGIYKIRNDGPVYITPDFSSAEAVAKAGSDIIAIDATDRPHPKESTKELIKRIHEELDRLVMADVSTLEEGIQASKDGADIVATTLSGYTSYSRQLDGPDFELISELVANVDVPVIAEGRIHSPEHAQKAIQAGAHAVVVGTAITSPTWLTSTYREAVEKG